MPALDFPSSPTNGQTYGGYYWDSTTGAWRSDPVPMGGLPAGSIIQWAGATAPANWLFADGAAVSRSTYASLFAAIGVTYGSGDGSTTFNLPDLRGRVAVGKNSGTFSTLGATGGAETVALTEAQMPAHNHNVMTNLVHGDGTVVNEEYINANLAAGSARRRYNNYQESKGGGQAHNNLQPYLVTNYIIKATSGWSAGDSELATRVGVLEAAPAGLVRVVPTSVSVASGSASVSATGQITLTSATDIRLQGIFSSAFRNYRIVANVGATGQSGAQHQIRFIQASGVPDSSSGYTYTNIFSQNGVSGAMSSNSVNQNVAWLGFAQDFTLDVFNPNTSSHTMALMQGVYQTTWVGGQAGFNAATPFTGFNLLNNTITGAIQVYGYRN